MNTEQIRDWLTKNVFDPLRGNGNLEITLRAGNIHDVLGLDNRYPMVCGACRTVHEHTEGVLMIEDRPGPDVNTRPPIGANVWYTYVIQ